MSDGASPHDGKRTQRRPAGVDDLEEFRRALIDIGLIDAAEFGALAAHVPASQGVPGLARLLEQAGRLTAYQAAAIGRGEGRDLLIGDYLILEPLGSGAPGTVFKARHRERGRIAALKVLPPSFAGEAPDVRRLRGAVAAAGRLRHPNVVRPVAVAEDRGVHFVVMEYAPGMDLERIVRDRGRLTLSQAIDVVIQAASGLVLAHARGIVHGHLEPSDLMLDAAGTVRLLGLDSSGIAADGATAIRAASYVAPEQSADRQTTDHRSDIYSLGCTLYFLLTARVPFGGATTLGRLEAHREQPAPGLKASRPDAPTTLQDIVREMMANQPADRPQSMTEVIERLESCRESVAETPSPRHATSKSAPRRTVSDEANPRTDKGRAPARATPSPGKRPFRPRPLNVALFIATAAVVCGVIGTLLWPRRPPRPAPTPPRAEESSPSPKPLPAPRPVARTIFDGRSGRGWMLTNRKPLPRASVQPDGLNPHGTGSYLVVYEKKLGNFTLDFDYKLSRGCNSGVFLRVGDLNDPVNTGIEVELADSAGSTDRDPGAFHGLLAPVKNAQRPAGEWNHMTVTAQGPTIAVTLNGADVSRIDVDEWTVPGRRPDGSAHGLDDVAIARLPRSGYLGFQDLRGDCWFKDIQLTTGDEGAGPSPTQ